MTVVRLTKMELRAQQGRLTQLERYLPTLQLKKAMLQTEVQHARLEIKEAEQVVAEHQAQAKRIEPLHREFLTFDLSDGAKVTHVEKRYENVAGVELPTFEGISFASLEYSLFETPPWVDGAIQVLRNLEESKVRVEVAEEKAAALEKELREVSLRVNLFEKVLIPRAQANIKKIKVFLGDQELAAVSQAKVAKAKIEERKRA
jgi:V/A-type H+/Na+-transporting ATPase subunit D